MKKSGLLLMFFVLLLLLIGLIICLSFASNKESSHAKFVKITTHSHGGRLMLD